MFGRTHRQRGYATSANVTSANSPIAAANGPTMRKLDCAKHFDPALFMGESWSAAEVDERADHSPAIDVSAIELVNCLKKEDELPIGEHCVRQLKETPYVRLGGRAFLALWENQTAIPDNWKKPLTFVFFDGLILRHRNGNRYSLYLSWHDGQWHWYSAWLGNTRSANSPSAVLAA
jgi:hypothetical protein